VARIVFERITDRLLRLPGEFLEPLVDLRLRFFGPGRYGEMLARVLVTFGADFDDVIDVMESSVSLTELAGNFSDLGWDWERRAKEELETGHPISARDGFKRAAVYYGVEAWAATSKAAIRDAYIDIKRCHGRFRDLSSHSVLDVEIPYRGKSLPGFFRMPAHGANRVQSMRPPLLVIIQGLDSLKEWLDLFERRALERGFATLNFDMPGNGESLARGIALHHPNDVRHVGVGVRQFIDENDAVDRRRVALFGFSLGGQWALTLTPLDIRPVAVATLGAPFDYSFLSRMSPNELRRAAFATGHDNVEAIRRKVEGVSLRETLGNIDVPVLIIHGELDSEVPVWHAEAIHDALRSPKELLVVEGEDHLATRSLRRRVLPYAFDWLLDRVLEREAWRATIRSTHDDN
jgi:2,6-dihydroxypseudooxynicotine hydrolase